MTILADLPKEHCGFYLVGARQEGSGGSAGFELGDQLPTNRHSPLAILVTWYST